MAGAPISKSDQARRRTRKGREPMPAEVVEAVHARSRGRCECSPGCTDRAEVLHHRRRRSQGGRHTVLNIAHLSDSHHRWVHDNPEASRAAGLLLASWDPMTPLAWWPADPEEGNDE